MNGAACEVAGFVSNRPSVSRCRRWCVWRRRSVVSLYRLRRRKALETCWSSTLESGTFLCVQWTGATTLGLCWEPSWEPFAVDGCGHPWTPLGDLRIRRMGPAARGQVRVLRACHILRRSTPRPLRDQGVSCSPDTGGARRSALEASAQFPRALSRGIQRVDQIDPTIKSVSPCVSWGQISRARRAVLVLGVDSYA